MPLILNSETQMVRDTAQEFFRERAPITALRKLRDTNDPDGFSRGLWREMAELGWTGFLVPEDFGGTDFGVLGLAQVMEAAGRTLAASALLSTSLLGASLLAMAGSEPQKSDHLPAMVAGERLFALALEEGSRHQPCRIATTAERIGEDYRISGQKVFVLDGHVADVLIVAARTSGGRDDRDGITLFLVPGVAPGVTRQRTIMIDSRNAAQVRLDSVAVAADAGPGPRWWWRRSARARAGPRPSLPCRRNAWLGGGGVRTDRAIPQRPQAVWRRHRFIPGAEASRCANVLRSGGHPLGRHRCLLGAG